MIVDRTRDAVRPCPPLEKRRPPTNHVHDPNASRLESQNTIGSGTSPLQHPLQQETLPEPTYSPSMKRLKSTTLIEPPRFAATSAVYSFTL